MSAGPGPGGRGRVWAMASAGFRAEEIAAVLGLDVATLRERHAGELERAPAEANAEVARNLFRIAAGDGLAAAPAAGFVLACRAGWQTSDLAEPLAELERMRAKLDEACERMARAESAAAAGGAG